MKDRDEWDYIRQNLELKPGIKTLSDYNDAVREGASTARDFLRQLQRTVYFPDHIRTAHELMFRDVHPWAGDFRKEEVEIANSLASKPENIARELRMVAQHAENWFQATTIKERATAIAAYHTAFEQVHPFLDGNGRVGRILLESQVQKELGCLVDMAADKERYYRALQSADERHNLNALRDLIIDTAHLGDRMLAEEADLKMQQAQQQDHGIER